MDSNIISTNTAISSGYVTPSGSTPENWLRYCTDTRNTHIQIILKPDDVNEAAEFFKNCNTTDFDSVLILHSILKNNLKLSSETIKTLSADDIILHGYLSNNYYSPEEPYMQNLQYKSLHLKTYHYDAPDMDPGDHVKYSEKVVYTTSDELAGGVALLVSLKEKPCKNPYDGENATEVVYQLSDIFKAKAKIYENSAASGPAVFVVLPDNTTKVPYEKLDRAS